MTATVAQPADSPQRITARLNLERQAAQSLAQQRAYLDTLIPAAHDAINADENDLRNAILTRGLDLLNRLTARDMFDLAATLDYLATAKAEQDAATGHRHGLRLVTAGAR